MGEKLAIRGGRPVRGKKLARQGERFGDEEIQLLTEVIRSQRLNCNSGTKVREFERAWADYLGVSHALMSTSGTAAIHIALGALNFEPGHEVITSPITDMGTIVPILMQNLVPVFADLDLDTFNLDPADVERRITSRTRAILVVHLAGNSADLDPIREIGRRYGINVIEDCAQSFNARYKGEKVGTIGDLGCFSFNQAKHISCGDGGVTVTNDPELARRAQLFSDKAWPRVGDIRDHLFLAPNYRVTELQAAVALAQLQKLDRITDTRTLLGDRLTRLIQSVPFVSPPRIYDGGTHTYWFYAFRVEAGVRDPFVRALNAEGITATGGYLPKPVYLYDVLKSKRTYGESGFPYGYAPFRPSLDEEIEYCEGLCPNAERLLQEMVRIPLNEFYTEADVDDIGRAIRKVGDSFQKDGVDVAV